MAQVVGQDGHLKKSAAGPGFELQQIPAEPMVLPLDESGTYTMPLWLLSEVVDGAEVFYTFVQDPPSNALFTGPQTVTVSLSAVGGTGYRGGTFDIQLVDVTPPNLQVSIFSNGIAPLVSPGGLNYFIAPASISSAVFATDNVDGLINPGPDLEVRIGCDTLVDVISMTEPGYYSLRVQAADTAGNKSYSMQIFEVRERLNLSATAVVEDILVIPNGAMDQIEAKILLASDELDSCRINLSTLALWVIDGEGNQIGSSPLRVPDGYDIGGAYDPAVASLQSCIWRMTLQGMMPAGAASIPGTRFMLTGSGAHGDSIEFDFMTPYRTFTAEINAHSEILTQVQPDCPCNNDPPPPPPPPPCKWKSQLIPDDDDSAYAFESGVCGGHTLVLRAKPTSINGRATAVDNCYDFPADSSISGAVASGGTFKVFLEPPDCCQDCTITIVARPKFKAHVDINPPANAVAGGVIGVATPCGNTQAIGGVAVGDYDTTVVNVSLPVGGGITIPIPVSEGEQNLTKAFTGNLSCVESSCSVDISIVTAAYLSANANATFLNWFSDAQSLVFDSKVGLTVTPHTNAPCVAIGNYTPFPVDGCQDIIPVP